MVVVHVQNPIVHFCSLTLGSSILDELASQVMPKLPSWNVWECKKLKRIGSAAWGRPTLLTTTKGGWSSRWLVEECHPRSKMSSTKHAGDLEMSQYAVWSTSGGTRLIHSHWKQQAHEPIATTSTYTNSLIQAQVYCHVANIVNRESHKGGTFSNTHAHECSWKVYKYYNTWTNSHNNPDLVSESP